MDLCQILSIRNVNVGEEIFSSQNDWSRYDLRYFPQWKSIGQYLQYVQNLQDTRGKRSAQARSKPAGTSFSIASNMGSSTE